MIQEVEIEGFKSIRRLRLERHPRRDSNPHLELRRLLLCPFELRGQALRPL
jgi:AAA15 family ATPase/GTPase